MNKIGRYITKKLMGKTVSKKLNNPIQEEIKRNFTKIMVIMSMQEAKQNAEKLAQEIDYEVKE